MEYTEFIKMNIRTKYLNLNQCYKFTFGKMWPTFVLDISIKRTTFKKMWNWRIKYLTNDR